MTEAMGKILIVDDDPEMCLYLTEFLTEEGYSAEAVQSGANALIKIDSDYYDVVITDLEMAGMKGLELIEKLRRGRDDQLIIVITAYGTIESAIKAMKLGAYDYITKPFKEDQLLLALERVMEKRWLRGEVERLRREVEGKYRFENILGQSAAMAEVFELIKRVANGGANILISGESGTGKELIARAIHYNSLRRGKPFVAATCAAIPAELMESELFGHVKGAFTGALYDKKGLIEEAAGGTIFFDEVSEIPKHLQVKLLRFIQEKEVRRVGSTKTAKIDVRVLAATNKDLKQAIEEGTFRDDLYYRLNVINIKVPLLRERRDDIPILIDHFLNKYSAEAGRRKLGVSREALNLLYNYSWPGNVRELENVVERAAHLSKGEAIMPEDLPFNIKEQTQAEDLAEKAIEMNLTLSDLEKLYIMKALKKAEGKVARAAEILGIDRSTLYRKLEQYSGEPAEGEK